jgi:hypothetical protein
VNSRILLISIIVIPRIACSHLLRFFLSFLLLLLWTNPEGGSHWASVLLTLGCLLPLLLLLLLV